MTLRMSGEDFAALAGCRPTGSALAVLRDGQISRRVVMLKSVADTARRTVPELWARCGAAEGWELCARARAADTDAFERVLLQPHVGVWLGRCLRALAGVGHEQVLAVDLARLGSLGVAAALRSGLAPELVLPVSGGLMWLPTLGMVELPEGTERVRLDGWTLDVAGRSVTLSEQWQWHAHTAADTPWLAAPYGVVVPPVGDGPSLSVVVEDADPYRESVHGHPVQSRQTRSQLADWERMLQTAWRLLASLLPERAAACAKLWTALVPLHPDPAGRGRSSSSREAYGAVAAAPQSDPVRFAETVVHETAHIAFAALTDLVDLADPRDRTRHRVGWRPDPRPVGAVLTGTYAHLALLEFWVRRGRALVGEPARAAEVRLRHYGRQVAAALRQLDGHRALTPWGAHFVEFMINEVDGYGFRVRRPQEFHPGGGREARSPLRVMSGDRALPEGTQARSPLGGTAESEGGVVRDDDRSAVEARRGTWTEQASAEWRRANGTNTSYCA
jgi:HEXXH motif-containing protein